MNWFKIISEDNAVYQLVATTDVTVEQDSKITSAKVEDKSVVSDNVVALNRNVRYNGIITTIDRLDQPDFKDPATFVEGIRGLMRDRKFVTCELDNLLTPIPNCQIEKFSISKGKSEGLTSWFVNLSIKEIRLSDAITSTTVAAPAQEVSDITSESVNEGSATTRAKKLSETIGTGALDNIIGGG